ncbi:MAG: hypothetical protein ACFFCZ_28675 [Promethearchaeota archaeon]
MLPTYLEIILAKDLGATKTPRSRSLAKQAKSVGIDLLTHQGLEHSSFLFTKDSLVPLKTFQKQGSGEDAFLNWEMAEDAFFRL